MISLKIEGLSEMLSDLRDSENWIDSAQIDAIVKSAAMPLVQKIKDGYIAGGHKKTGSLVNSIEAFQRARKKTKDPYFTYYVGPRYTSAKSLFSYGGNAAHLLEYGTVERFRADSKKGGLGKKLKGQKTGLSRVYGAKINTGKVRPYGIIRRAYDEYNEQGQRTMIDGIVNLIKVNSTKLGK